MLGSEGTLGVITGVTFSLRRAAEARRLATFEVATMQAGFDLQRDVLQHVRLVVIRVDVVEFEENHANSPRYARCTASLLRISWGVPIASTAPV